MVHCLKMQVPRGPDLRAIGPVGAISHKVDSKLALGGLDGGIDLALRHTESLGIQLEVMNQGFH